MKIDATSFNHDSKSEHVKSEQDWPKHRTLWNSTMTLCTLKGSIITMDKMKST